MAKHLPYFFSETFGQTLPEIRNFSVLLHLHPIFESRFSRKAEANAPPAPGKLPFSQTRG